MNKSYPWILLVMGSFSLMLLIAEKSIAGEHGLLCRIPLSPSGWSSMARGESVEPGLFRLPCDAIPDMFRLNRDGDGGPTAVPVRPRPKTIEGNTSRSGSTSGDHQLDLGQIHKYLGLTTIALSGITVLSSSDRSLHHAAAYATTGAAVVTCLTGYIFYRDRFNLADGIFSRYNLHMILGTLGTIGCATATVLADSDNDSSHGGFGGAGASSMLVAVVVVKW